MFLRFDPSKIVLPPVLGGPAVHYGAAYNSSSGPSQSTGKRKRNHMASEHDQDVDSDLSEGGSSSGKTRLRPNQEASLKEPLLSFQTRQELIEALRDRFQQNHSVDFAGSYRVMENGVSHKQRIQTLTHEIWKATGYRFTVKDHPRTKQGHRTRLWCSQDEAHKSKSSRSAAAPRVTSDGTTLAKTRYPCRSGLLISSRDDSPAGMIVVVVRMHHHYAHEPYYDASLPAEMTQSIWETMGWRQNRSAGVQQSSVASEGIDSDVDSSDDEGDAHSHIGADTQRASTSSQQPDGLMLDPETYQKRMKRHIETIRDFCDGLEYQLPFNDYRMLEVLEREGAQFLRLVNDCLEKEGRLRPGDRIAPMTVWHSEIDHTVSDNRPS